MKKYRPKTPAANVADKLLRALLTAALGVGWFVWLWGLSLPALTAGLALGGLFWLCARLLGKKHVEKRERQMRRMIGGELALERLLLMKESHAAFLAALWLGPKEPVEMERAADFGVLGTLRGKRVLVRLAARHKSEEVGVREVIEAIRLAREHHAQECLLCLTSPASREAVAYAARAEPEIRIFERSEMILLAGLHSPATDEELARLKQKKPRRKSAGEWASVVLDPSRARRYFWYGAGLSALAFITGQGFYPIPAVACMVLFAGCKLRERKNAAP